MAPSRPLSAKQSSLTQTTLNGSFVQPSSRKGTPISDPRRISKPSRGTTKSAGRTNSNRIHTDVLLSIKPEHLTNIANRRKNHEYRKYKLAEGVSRLWFYETRDGGRGRASITCVFLSTFSHTFSYFYPCLTSFTASQ